MIRTYRYPLKPTRDQVRVLYSWLSYCCDLYNAALEHRIGAWQQSRVSVSYNAQSVELTGLRADDDLAASIPVDVQRSALRRVDRAFQAFFRRVKSGDRRPGFPRFRSRRRYDSFGIGRVTPDGDRVRVPKLGAVRFHLYRPLVGEVKEVTIRRSCGRWFVCFNCEVGAAPAKRAVRSAIGVDLGLTAFAVTSEGRRYANPRHFKRGEELLAKRQRRLARRRRGSKSRERARLLVAKAHEHVKRQRLDHAWKLAGALVAEHDLIAVEALNIAGLARMDLSKSVADAGWRVFLERLALKAECAGVTVVEVDPRGTSQRCSGCSEVVEKRLWDRVHDCPHCGLVLDRDWNAALNILNLGYSPGKGEAAA
jgi:putative transposase